MMKELKALESLLQDENFVHQLQTDKMLKITYNTLYNYVKKGNSLSNLPWFDLAKRKVYFKLAA